MANISIIRLKKIFCDAALYPHTKIFGVGVYKYKQSVYN